MGEKGDVGPMGPHGPKGDRVPNFLFEILKYDIL